ncbi:MAG: hypothetical protein ABI566_08745 [Pseudolysinimonas sp.]
MRIAPLRAGVGAAVVTAALLLAGCTGLQGKPRDVLDDNTWTLTQELRALDGVEDASASGAYEGTWPIWVEVMLADDLDRDETLDTMVAIHDTVIAADRFGEEFGRYELKVFAIDPVDHPSGVGIVWDRGLPAAADGVRADTSLWLDLIDQAPAVSVWFQALGTRGHLTVLREVAADGTLADPATLEPLYQAVFADAGLDPAEFEVDIE